MNTKYSNFYIPTPADWSALDRIESNLEEAKDKLAKLKAGLDDYSARLRKLELSVAEVVKVAR